MSQPAQGLEKLEGDLLISSVKWIDDKQPMIQDLHLDRKHFVAIVKAKNIRTHPIIHLLKV